MAGNRGCQVPFIPTWHGTGTTGRPRSIGRSSPALCARPPRSLPPSPARTPLDRFPPTNTRRGLHQKHMQNKTNANPQAISSARAHKPAAVLSPSVSPTTNTFDVAPPELEPKVPSPPPPPFASDRWAAGGASSSDDEEDVKKTTTKKGATKRAPAAAKKSTRPKGKDKYLAATTPSHMPGGAPDFDVDDALPLSSFDPFADEDAADGAGAGASNGAGDDGRVHLRVQQRNGRKTLTTVQGLSTGYNYAKVLRDLKRELCCNGTVVEDKELGNVIQLQGDHRKKVAAFIAKAGLAKTDCIKVHGF